MKIEKFAIIGHPIKHTMSPYIHNRLFSLSGFSPDYEIFDIKELSANIDFLRKLDGINVTIPHKMNIIPLLDKIETKAEHFGSVNTIKNENGIFTGYTTDGAGCIKALKRHKADIDGEILVLGSGGAARAIAFDLLENSKTANITLAVRNFESGMKLKQDMNVPFTRVITLEALEKETLKYDTLINATSVGMYPNSGFSPVGESVVERCNSVFDAVYNPHVTRLIETAIRLNKNIIFGMEMLVLQAVCAHEIWYGAKFENCEVDEICIDASEETARLFSKKD